MDFSWNQLADPKFVFHDHSLVETVREGNPEAQAFFRLLALCHTVMPEEKKEGERPLMDICITTWRHILRPLCVRFDNVYTTSLTLSPLSFFYLQESSSIRLSPLMKVPWSRQRETLGLCFAPAPQRASRSLRWANRSPMSFWLCLTSIMCAKGCQS